MLWCFLLDCCTTQMICICPYQINHIQYNTIQRWGSFNKMIEIRPVFTIHLMLRMLMEMTSYVHSVIKRKGSSCPPLKYTSIGQMKDSYRCWNEVFIIFCVCLRNVFYQKALSLAVTQLNGEPNESIRESIADPSSSVRTFKSKSASAAMSILLYYTGTWTETPTAVNQKSFIWHPVFFLNKSVFIPLWIRNVQNTAAFSTAAMKIVLAARAAEPNYRPLFCIITHINSRKSEWDIGNKVMKIL